MALGYANVSRPLGFNPLFPVGRVHSNVVTRPTTVPRHAATGGNASLDLAVGDAYALDNAGFAYRAGPSDVVRGIVIGFVFQANPLVMNGAGPVSIDYLTGTSTPAPVVIGVEDNGAEFNVQSDTLSLAQVGGAVNLADAAPDPTYRQSRQTINVGGGAGTQFRITGLVNDPASNSFGTNARAVVRLLTALQG
jgi:hypothetical protein